MSYPLLRTATEYSLQEGLLHVGELVQFAVEAGANAVGVTDLNCTMGLAELERACAKASASAGRTIKPIYGVQLLVELGEGVQPARVALLAKNDAGFRFILGAAGLAGLRPFGSPATIPLSALEGAAGDVVGVLCAADTLADLEGGGREASAWLARADQLAEMDKLIGSTFPELAASGAGSGRDPFAAGGPQPMRGPSAADCAQLADLFDHGDLYVELDAACEAYGGLRHRNDAARGLARGAGLPLVVTGGCRYALPGQSPAFSARSLRGIARRLRGKPPADFGECRLRDEPELRELFTDEPEVLENARKIAGSCNVSPQFSPAELAYGRLLPPPSRIRSGLRDRCLRRLAGEHGLARECAVTGEGAEDRVNRELDMFEAAGMLGGLDAVAGLLAGVASAGGAACVYERGALEGHSYVLFLLGNDALDPLRYGFDLRLRRDRAPQTCADAPEWLVEVAGVPEALVVKLLRGRFGDGQVAVPLNIMTSSEAVAREAAEALPHVRDPVEVAHELEGRAVAVTRHRGLCAVAAADLRQRFAAVGPGFAPDGCGEAALALGAGQAGALGMLTVGVYRRSVPRPRSLDLFDSAAGLMGRPLAAADELALLHERPHEARLWVPRAPWRAIAAGMRPSDLDDLAFAYACDRAPVDELEAAARSMAGRAVPGGDGPAGQSRRSYYDVYRALDCSARLWMLAHDPVTYLLEMLNGAEDGLGLQRAAGAAAFGVRVLPADVNESGYDCTAEDGGIRLGLRLYADAAASKVSAERRGRGPYTSLADALARLRPDAALCDALEALARAGAFASTLEHEGRLVRELNRYRADHGIDSW